MSTSMIIGIHGLHNKVDEATLEKWWLEAIAEGMRRNLGREASIAFDLAYWASVRHANPVSLAHEVQPYIAAPGEGELERQETGMLLLARGKAHEWLGKPVDWGKSMFDWSSSERLLGLKLEDLSEYYLKPSIREAIREKLRVKLNEYAGNRLLLFAHSMGSIIAYDVLRGLEGAAGFEVEHLVTLGSPLGLPLVSKNIRDEFGGLRTPTNVRRWTNVADPGDKVALDFNLADEFEANREGIGVTDLLVSNGYVGSNAERNRHKSYGYLRAPEVSDILDDFIA